MDRQADFDNIDERAKRLMRAANVQQMIEVLIPTDPPRTLDEHLQAGGFLLGNIVRCQPRILDRSATAEVAYEVHAGYPCAFSPLTLIRAHSEVAIILLIQGRVEEAMASFVVSTQGTAGQFSSDRILVSGGKLAFALLAGLIHHRRYEPMFLTALECQVAAEKGSLPNHWQVHSSQAITLCRDLFFFIQNCALVTGHNRHLGGQIGEVDLPPLDRLLDVINQDARDLDRRTDRKLDIQGWLGSQGLGLGV